SRRVRLQIPLSGTQAAVQKYRPCSCTLAQLAFAYQDYRQFLPVKHAAPSLWLRTRRRCVEQMAASVCFSRKGPWAPECCLTLSSKRDDQGQRLTRGMLPHDRFPPRLTPVASGVIRCV